MRHVYSIFLQIKMERLYLGDGIWVWHDVILVKETFYDLNGLLENIHANCLQFNSRDNNLLVRIE